MNPIIGNGGVLAQQCGKPGPHKQITKYREGIYTNHLIKETAVDTHEGSGYKGAIENLIVGFQARFSIDRSTFVRDRFYQCLNTVRLSTQERLKLVGRTHHSVTLPFNDCT